MARVIGKLAAVAVARLGPGLHGDGGGLYLHVGASGARSWVYRFMLNGKAREMGLGPVHTIGLAEARRRAAECRTRRLDGVDPIAARDALKLNARLDAAKTITFQAAAGQYLRAHAADWKNAKHAAQWEATLAAYVYPVFGTLPVGGVDVGLVMQAVEPIWAAKPETATRVRGRIEAVLDWAGARGYRAGDNPARWRGHLDKLLSAPAKAKRLKRQKAGQGEHHAALPYGEIAGFIAELRAQPGVAARALEFAILTAARTGEVLGARWSEIDLAARLWTVPAERMKAGRAHLVPLSEAAIFVHEHENRSAELRGDYVFPGGREGRPLSNMAFLMLLRRMQRGDLTAHGFRSTFRDWVGDRTNFERDLAELALAHAVGDKVEQAYRRGTGFDKRVRLMDAWARFCDAPAAAGDVIPLKRA